MQEGQVTCQQISFVVVVVVENFHYLFSWSCHNSVPSCDPINLGADLFCVLSGTLISVCDEGEGGQLIFFFHPRDDEDPASKVPRVAAIIAFFTENRRTRYSWFQGQPARGRSGTIVGESCTMTAHPRMDFWLKTPSILKKEHLSYCCLVKNTLNLL